MADVMRYPYSDDLMRFDEESRQYVITEEGLRRNGCELRANLADTVTTSADLIIDAFLHGVSEVIYAYIHDFNVDNEIQDAVISTVPGMRNVIYRALCAQGKYTYLNGALEYSAKKEEQEMAVSPVAKAILKNSGILYTGNLCRW